MIRLELSAFGRFLRLSLGWQWSWWWAFACGCLVLDAGPLSVRVYGRRMRWR